MLGSKNSLKRTEARDKYIADRRTAGAGNVLAASALRAEQVVRLALGRSALEKRVKMKNVRKYFSRVSLLITTLGVVAIQNTGFTQNKADKIDELVCRYAEYGYLNGVVLVAEKGTIIYKKAFGLANMEWEIPNAVDTKFRIYSMTKQFTAMLVMQLVEEGKIKLEHTISEYLPYYRKDIGNRVTIHQLLTHTHGITEPSDDMLPIFISEPIEDAIKTYFNQDLEFQPGSNFEYSGLGGYVTIGAILEKVMGKKYESLLKERILEPLNMKNTAYLNYHTIIENRASDYRDMYKGMIHRIQPYPVHANGASSIVSTVDDLFLWDQALYSEKLISRIYRDLLFTPHAMPESRSYQYGYGWYIEDFNIGGQKKRIILHTGGSVCIIFRDVENRHTVIILNNVRSISKREEICIHVMNILYDHPYTLPKKPIRNFLLKTILEKNVNSAIKQYYDLKSRFSQIYDFEEAELNFLGYRLLGLNKIEEAIEIFKLNTEAFPTSSEVYDGLGEAYMVQGNKKLAIKNYKKSLELNPGNTKAIELLKKLEK